MQIKNLVRCDKALFKKSTLLNTFGSLAMSGMLIMGSVGLAGAANTANILDIDLYDEDASVNTTITIGNVLDLTNLKFMNITSVVPAANENMHADIDLLPNGTLNLSTVSSSRLVQRIIGYADANDFHFDMTGGTLTINAAVADSYATLDAKIMKISDGTVTVTGNSTVSWFNNSAYIAGYRGLSITGGTLNIKTAHLLAGVTDGQTDDTRINLLIGGDTVINLIGLSDLKNAGFIRASASQATMANYGILVIESNAKINVEENSFGAIMSRKTNMTGGIVTVKSGANLFVAGAAKKSADLVTDMNDPGNGKWGEFNITGGLLDVAATGTLNMGTYEVDLVLDANGNLTSAGTLTLDDLTINGGTLALTAAKTNTATSFYDESFGHSDGNYKGCSSENSCG